MQKQKLLVNIVDQIVIMKKNSIDCDTSLLENQIDNLVYRLYELTWDEVRVIDPDFGLTEEEYKKIEI